MAVSACTEAAATGVEAFAATDDAVASTTAPPAGAAASTVAEAGVSLDESTVVSTEAGGVETFALAPALVERSASAEAVPRSTETAPSGFFGCDEPAAGDLRIHCQPDQRCNDQDDQHAHLCASRYPLRRPLSLPRTSDSSFAVDASFREEALAAAS